MWGTRKPFKPSRTRGPSQFDDFGVQVVVGLVCPTAILALVAYNLMTWTVLLPRSKRYGNDTLIVSYDDHYLVLGIMLFKLAMAVALFSWYWIANRKSIGRFNEFGLLTAFLLAIGGIVSVVYEFAYC